MSYYRVYTGDPYADYYGEEPEPTREELLTEVLLGERNVAPYGGPWEVVLSAEADARSNDLHDEAFRLLARLGGDCTSHEVVELRRRAEQWVSAVVTGVITTERSAAAKHRRRQAPIDIEPARYAHSGPGVMVHHLRDDYADDWRAYSIDAPGFVPRGGLLSVHLSTGLYARAAEPRP